VEVDAWDAPMLTFSTVEHAALYLRTMGMGDEEAGRAAGGLDLPLTLTMRGCIVYASKS
jgi:hypothetical protein